jgi:hypothetical protein
MSFLTRSYAGLAVVLAAVLTCGSLTVAVANVKHHGHTSHLPSWHAERDFGHGWTLHRSDTMKDLYGVVTAKVTFAASIRATVGILVTAT